MKRVLGKTFNLIFSTDKKYTGRIIINKLKQLFSRKIENKYLFILSPPYCGSTLLNELLSTSKFVSVNNPFGNREGQSLPTVKKIMFAHKRRWDTTLDFDWEYIKKEWRKYWDTTKPILLEKSPPNIIRAASINKVFPNSYFIIFYRNPYAHCESIIRRDKSSPKSAATFALKCLEYQKKNILLPINSMSISYEELTITPEKFKRQLNKFIPQLNDIKIDIEFSAHNFKNKKMNINNLNNEKINKLNQIQINEINEVFMKNIELLNYFNYQLIKKHTQDNL